MILMPQIFDVTANENARYKRNELEFLLVSIHISTTWWVSLLVDQGVPEGTCSQVL